MKNCILKAVLAIALLCLASNAQSHDEWLNHSQVDPVTKKLCCGESDCLVVPTEDIHITPGGYQFSDPTTHELVTIAYARAQPAPDGAYRRCRWGGEVQCFFAPPLGT